jgi:hypothetical protein
MTASAHVLPLLVFEAADCLMAVPASEVAQLEKQLEGSDPIFTEIESRSCFDLEEYFAQGKSNGPWLRWARGTASAWLRVRRVIDVVPVALATLTPMPAVFKARRRSRAFLAAGLRGDDVFLLLDPARLRAGRFGEAGV